MYGLIVRDDESDRDGRGQSELEQSFIPFIARVLYNMCFTQCIIHIHACIILIHRHIYDNNDTLYMI